MPLDQKLPYDRTIALAAVKEHAEHFLRSREVQCAQWSEAIGRPAVITASYDAELFGHWWFEGPEFLDLVARGASDDASGFLLATPADVLDEDLMLQVAMPAQSSWGIFGHSEAWLNDRNNWIWPHLHGVTGALASLPDAADTPSLEAAYNQLAREAILASASDWPFMISSNTVLEYAKEQLVSRISGFNQLLAGVQRGRLDEILLADLRAKIPSSPISTTGTSSGQALQGNLTAARTPQSAAHPSHSARRTWRSNLVAGRTPVLQGRTRAASRAASSSLERGPIGVSASRYAGQTDIHELPSGRLRRPLAAG